MVVSGRVVAPYTAEELQLMRALAGEANNLNQITKLLNKHDALYAGFAKSMIRRLQKLFYDSKKH
ncbi:MAG: plasmid mobilization relaxosome protein MobC [Rikenellaceae bacterium]